MISYLMPEVKKAVQERVPNAKLVLFGSRARGDAKSDSDWDVLILVDKDRITANDFSEICDPVFDIGFQTGEYVSPRLYTFEEWDKRKFTPFYKNVTQDGIVL